jgi:hypothetical protein
MRIQSLIVVFALMAVASAAWSQSPPFVHAATVGVTPIQAAPANPLRKKIVLFNPNATAVLAFCPAGPNRDTGLPVTCAVNGAGSITLQPNSGLVLQGSNGYERLSMSSAWNVVANTGGSAYTFLDLE